MAKEKKSWAIKIIGSVITVVIVTLFSVFIATIIEINTEQEYCGIVTEKYITPAGYKIFPKHRVVFYCDSIKRKINIDVTPNTYSNMYIGKRVCFDLIKRQTE